MTNHSEPNNIAVVIKAPTILTVLAMAPAVSAAPIPTVLSPAAPILIPTPAPTPAPIITQESPNMAFTDLNLKTDFDKLYNLFVTFFKKEPAWATVAETDLAYVAGTINTLVTKIYGSTVDVVVSAVITNIQRDLVLATRYIQALDFSQNLTDVLNSLLSNLQGLLTLSGIKSSALVNEITVVVSGIVTEIETILTAKPKA